MILGRVVGHVWATRKHGKLARHKLLLVRPHAWYRPAHEVALLVAVDVTGAGPGEDVVVCLGKPARDAIGDGNAPVEAAVVAIVDRVTMIRGAFEGRRPLALTGVAPAHLEIV